MDSLYELAVKGLMGSGCSVEQFNNLPSEIKTGLIPKIIEKLSIMDDNKKKLDDMNRQLDELIERVQSLRTENRTLRQDVKHLRAYYCSNLRPRHPYLPLPDLDPLLDDPVEPELNRNRLRNTDNFSFKFD